MWLFVCLGVCLNGVGIVKFVCCLLVSVVVRVCVLFFGCSCCLVALVCVFACFCVCLFLLLAFVCGRVCLFVCGLGWRCVLLVGVV